MKLRLYLLLLLALVPKALSGQATGCETLSAKPTSAEQALGNLRILRVNGCLGEENCPTALCAQFTQWATTPDAQRALEVLTATRNSAAGAGKSLNLDLLIQQIDAWIVVLGKDELAISVPSQWQYDIGGGGLFLNTPREIDINGSIRSRCTVSVVACASAYAEAIEIISDAAIVRRVNGVLLTSLRHALVEYVTALDKRWQDYFNKSPAQYPWELLINSALYQRRERRGFNEPPSSQLIVLHPSAAYEYTRAEKEHFKSTLALDALGYFKRNVGASVVLAWSDRTIGSQLGYGAAVHFQNKASIGATYHGGEGHHLSVLFSPNIEKLLAANAEKVRDLLTHIH